MDVTTALAERIAITSANVNDGPAGPDAVPDDPGDVFADSAYRDTHFRDAVLAKGGMRKRPTRVLKHGSGQSIESGGGSKRSSGHGSAATVSDECDDAVWRRLLSRYT
ncbi:transposase [Acetobacter orleanensis]|uniref:transposase n=1 Tax=Acetobacter orleanensis TaxID=104099 RepID=UPI001FCD618F|nr:transposase [Acetobacter orleanensis]